MCGANCKRSQLPTAAALPMQVVWPEGWQMEKVKLNATMVRPADLSALSSMQPGCLLAIG